MHKLCGGFDGCLRIRRIIGFENRNRSPQHTATFIEQIDGHIGPMHIMNGRGLVRARERIKDPDLDRLCRTGHRLIGRRTEHTVGQVATEQRAAGHG
ncbi:MAG: hypothetical protein AABZ34_10795 [Nitrospirota bacterium]